ESGVGDKAFNRVVLGLEVVEFVPLEQPRQLRVRLPSETSLLHLAERGPISGRTISAAFLVQCRTAIRAQRNPEGCAQARGGRGFKVDLRDISQERSFCGYVQLLSPPALDEGVGKRARKTIAAEFQRVEILQPCQCLGHGSGKIVP